MINRYYGNTGRVERFPEAHEPPPAPPAPKKPPPPPPAKGGLDLNRLMRRFDPRRLEQEDLLLALILWLLYRESGEQELLIALGAMLFL